MKHLQIRAITKNKMIICVASGKGGTGKTFVSTNLFTTMKRRGHNVVLTDCDAEVPNSGIFINKPLIKEEKVKVFCPEISFDKCTYCGKCADLCNFHAITCIPEMDYINVLPDICHGCRMCEYVCKEEAITPIWKNIGKVTSFGDNDNVEMIEARVNVKQLSPVPIIRKAIETASAVNCDYVLLDSPPGCSCPFVNTALHADFVLLVTEPTPFGLSDLKHTIEVLESLHKRCGVIINRSDLGDSEMRNYLSSKNIEVFAEIPYSNKVAECYASGRIVVEEYPEFEELFVSLIEKIKRYEDSSC